MQKVISINLNGHAYQLDESGYETLSAYLARADRALADNPDRAEILADLEQAIADKCQAYLGAHKSVVSASDVDRIVGEMGPVDGAAGDAADASGTSSRADQDTNKDEASPRRLYRILDGAMVGGVCNGLAAYFHIDVTIVRAVCLLAALLTKGFAIMAYIALMFIIPEAKTPEARAAAGGAPLNAKDVIERAKRQYAEGHKHWRRHWRQQRRHWHRYGWSTGMRYAYGPPSWAAALAPVFALAHLALFLTMAAMLISLVNTGAILQWRLPEDVPLWAGALILLVGYQIAVSPLRAVHFWTSTPGAAGRETAGVFAFWNAVIWLAGMAFGLWLASNHIPEIREFLQNVPELFRDFIQAIKDLVER